MNNNFQNKNWKTNGFDKTDPNQTPPKPNSLITTIGQLLPFAPIVYEQFTGQKVPAVTGTLAEMQMALVNIQTSLQTITNDQQQLVQRLIQLENSANQQLNNLTHQFKNLRLTHTKEQKQIEYNPPHSENKEGENY